MNIARWARRIKYPSIIFGCILLWFFSAWRPTSFYPLVFNYSSVAGAAVAASVWASQIFSMKRGVTIAIACTSGALLLFINGWADRYEIREVKEDRGTSGDTHRYLSFQ